MSYKGKVENGQIDLPTGTTLPEGAEVMVAVMELREQDFPEWARGLIPLIKSVIGR